MTRDTAERARERFVAIGACGGEYAVVWDRERQQVVFPYLRTGADISDDQIRAVAGELNGLLTQVQAEARLEGLKEAFLLRPRLVKEWDSAQFREGYYSGLEAFRQAIQAVLAQALQLGEKEAGK